MIGERNVATTGNAEGNAEKTQRFEEALRLIPDKNYADTLVRDMKTNRNSKVPVYARILNLSPKDNRNLSGEFELFREIMHQIAVSGAIPMNAKMRAARNAARHAVDVRPSPYDKTSMELKVVRAFRSLVDVAIPALLAVFATLLRAPSLHPVVRAWGNILVMLTTALKSLLETRQPLVIRGVLALASSGAWGVSDVFPAIGAVKCAVLIAMSKFLTDWVWKMFTSKVLGIALSPNDMRELEVELETKVTGIAARLKNLAKKAPVSTIDKKALATAFDDITAGVKTVLESTRKLEELDRRRELSVPEIQSMAWMWSWVWRLVVVSVILVL
jgi:hypothetical protein